MSFTLEQHKAIDLYNTAYFIVIDYHLIRSDGDRYTTILSQLHTLREMCEGTRNVEKLSRYVRVYELNFAQDVEFVKNANIEHMAILHAKFREWNSTSSTPSTHG